MEIKNIFIIGAGTMGNGIAQLAATSGYGVSCMDVQPAALEKAKASIQKSTAKLLEKGVITAEQKASTEKIHFVPDMTHIAEADLVIEAATENPELKFKIFREMDEKAQPNATPHPFQSQRLPR
jgi:3-hydroxybutyryl-CoA dehydrogenase